MESEYRVSRVGKPPKRFMLNKPFNGVILEETFDVNRGDVDANNNRTYIGVYRRVVRLLANTTYGFYVSTFSLPGWGSVSMMSWWPPNKTLASPADPRFEGSDDDFGEISRHVFESEPLIDQGQGKTYRLGDAPSIYGTP